MNANDSKAQRKMEQARQHRDELGYQIAGFLDAGGADAVPRRLRRLYADACDALDRAKNAVREECREEWRRADARKGVRR